MRAVDDRNILDAFCIDFADVVQQHTDYIVVSGFVAISSGRARGTEDIDMIIRLLSQDAFTALHEALVAGGFVCMQSADAAEIFTYLADNLSVRYTRKNTFLPEMELKFAKDELDEYQLATKTKLELTGLPLWFSNINVNVAFKEYYLKSDKDIEDARHLRIVYAERIDENEIQHVITLIKRCRL
jgi:hypothetical protein